MIKITYNIVEKKETDSTKLLRTIENDNPTEKEKIALNNVMNAFDNALSNLEKDLTEPSK